MPLHSMPLSVPPAAFGATPRTFLASALACSVRVLPAVAEGGGQPTMAGLSWHCSVQVSKVREPFAAGVTACTNRNHAYAATASVSLAVAGRAMVGAFAAGSAADTPN